MYLFLLALIYLAFISLGLPDSLLGSAWPSMREVFGVPISYMGIISMTISGGTICSSLCSERLTKKFGTRIVTVCSVLLTAVALLGFSISNRFWMLWFWSIPYGLGAGSIDAALNNYVALHYNSRHMSWLHCFWGVGTIISPYVMSYALVHSVWQDGYRIVAGIQITIAAILLVTLPVWKVNREHAYTQEKQEVLGIKGALQVKGVPYLLVGFFCYCAGESTMMLWATSYLVEARNINKELAAAFGALFFIGMTVGRFLAGIVSEKIGDKNMIRIGSAIIACGGILLLIPWKNDLAVLIGLVVVGLGCAPIYPSIIHSTPTNFGEKNSQAIIGIQIASASAGATFMPPVYGLIANHISVKLFPVYILFIFIMMFTMIELTYKNTKKSCE